MEYPMADSLEQAQALAAAKECYNNTDKGVLGYTAGFVMDVVDSVLIHHLQLNPFTENGREAIHDNCFENLAAPILQKTGADKNAVAALRTNAKKGLQ